MVCAEAYRESQFIGSTLFAIRSWTTVIHECCTYFEDALDRRTNVWSCGVADEHDRVARGPVDVWVRVDAEELSFRS